MQTVIGLHRKGALCKAVQTAYFVQIINCQVFTTSVPWHLAVFCWSIQPRPCPCGRVVVRDARIGQRNARVLWLTDKPITKQHAGV